MSAILDAILQLQLQQLTTYLLTTLVRNNYDREGSDRIIKDCFFLSFNAKAS